MLIACPACNHDVSDQAPFCPACGHPLRVIEPTPSTPAKPRFSGPPVDCFHCGGALKAGASATSEGSGCLLIIVGVCLTPFLIGIPIAIYGLVLSNRREGFWQCVRCGTKYARKIGMLEWV